MSERIPETDSIRELAQFWDTHDLTDFEDQLEQVAEPLFQRGEEVRVELQPREAEAVAAMAKSKGLASADLIRQWILEKVHVL